jgi:hypothetical protein
MSDQVIVFVADEKFLPHVPSIAVNCRREGEFKGDFLLIHPDDLDVSDFMRRGFVSLPVPDRGFLMKFDLFHPFLKVWKQAMFLDCDCIVLKPLSMIFDQLNRIDLVDGTLPILADRDDGPSFSAWQQWDTDHEQHGLRTEKQDRALRAIVEPGSVYAMIAERFPAFLTERMWNTSVLAWEPLSVPDDTVDQLRALQAEFAECNRPDKGGTDQQVIDLLLHHHIRPMPNKLCCWWGLNEAANRIPSEYRGWDGTETPSVIHLGRWYAQWIEKTPPMDAYYNDVLGVICHEFYQRNLADFDTVFPIDEGVWVTPLIQSGKPIIWDNEP